MKSYDSFKKAVKSLKEEFTETTDPQTKNVGLVLKKEGVFYTFLMRDQPCWGGIRKYQVEENPEGCDDHVEKPDDLYCVMPQGTIEYIIISEGYEKGNSNFIDKFLKVAISEKSPWKKGLNLDTISYNRMEDRLYLEMINPDVQPTVFINFLMTLSFILGGDFDRFQKYKDFDTSILFYTSVFGLNAWNNSFAPMSYNLCLQTSMKNFHYGNIKSKKIKSLKYKGDYDRKFVHTIFKEENDAKTKEVLKLLNKHEGDYLEKYEKVFKPFYEKQIEEGR